MPLTMTRRIKSWGHLENSTLHPEAGLLRTGMKNKQSLKTGLTHHATGQGALRSALQKYITFAVQIRLDIGPYLIHRHAYSSA